MPILKLMNLFNKLNQHNQKGQKVEYQVSQVLTYWVNADSRAEALQKWNDHPKTGATPWTDGDIELSDEHVEMN